MKKEYKEVCKKRKIIYIFLHFLFVDINKADPHRNHMRRYNLLHYLSVLQFLEGQVEYLSSHDRNHMLRRIRDKESTLSLFDIMTASLLIIESRLEKFIFC